MPGPRCAGFSSPPRSQPGAWWTPSGLAEYEYDPEKAKQILEGAGLTGTKLQLAAPSGDALRRFAELAHEDLNAVGLDVELAPVPQSEYYAKTVAGEIRFTPMRWTQRADPDGLIQYLFASDGTANSSKYSNEQVDEWIYAARVETDQEAQGALREDPAPDLGGSAVHAGRLRQRVQCPAHRSRGVRPDA
jgi:peptide/nickel transport system substrate-binding protein